MKNLYLTFLVLIGAFSFALAQVDLLSPEKELLLRNGKNVRIFFITAGFEMQDFSNRSEDDFRSAMRPTLTQIPNRDWSYNYLRIFLNIISRR